MDYEMGRTDLAVELNESISKKSGKLKGIVVNEFNDTDTAIKVTEIKITDKRGADAIGKPQGSYITIEAKDVSNASEMYKKKVVDILSEYIKKLLKDNISDDKCEPMTLLVAGLGNRCITSDSLGPLVVDGLMVNHHILIESGDDGGICAIIPGVMADTGLETADIIKGIAKQVKPSAIIAIDALAARDISRLNTTIQLSDRGINPGSGVGNHREGINEDNIGVPVLALGVPTVIDAFTIAIDLVSPLMKEFTAEEKSAFFMKIYKEGISDMYVTPKAIDTDVQNISTVISEAINMVL